MNTSMYSQAAFETAQQAQMAELEERLAGDTTVVSARQKLANAQASLEQLQTQTRTMPYAQRVRYLADIQASKQAVIDAEKEVRAAINANAQMYRRVKVEEESAQLARRQTELQEQHAREQEAAAKAEYKPHYIQSGGTEAQFEKAWVESIWPKELEARAAEQVAMKRNAHYDL